MKFWFQRRSEALQVLAAWITGLVIICGIWLVSVLYLLEDARSVNSVRLAADRIRIHELEARRAEKDFELRALTDPDYFRSGLSPHLERHRRALDSLRQEIRRLSGAGSSQAVARATAVADAVDQYEKGFRGLVQACFERGYGGSGLEGTLGAARNDLEDWSQRQNDPAYDVALSRLGREEQAFLRDPGAENATRVVGAVGTLRRVSARRPDELEPELASHLAAYEDAFGRLRTNVEHIGYDEELGLQGELRSAIHVLEPIVREILDEAVQNDERANRKLMIEVLATCCIMGALLAFAIFFAQAARLRNRSLIRVNQRMEEEHAKLLQAERLAAIGQTVTGLAHESRNAFQRTHACLDMLAEEVKDRPEALRLVGRIGDTQDHIHQLYEEVREYAGPVQVRRAPVSLSEVVRGAWDRLDQVRQSRTAHLTEESLAEASRLVCVVDAFALEQVFRNIFENALAACQHPVAIQVTYRESFLETRPAIQVSVTDNGPGLGAEQRARIFEPFYTTKTRGTGLGMAIARRLVEAHGGTIEVGPREKGAEILVTVPRDLQGKP